MHSTTIVSRTVATGLMLSVLSVNAFAQTSPRPATRAAGSRVERVAVTVGGGVQTRTPGFAEIHTATLYAEEARFENSYGAKGGNLFEVGAAARVWRNLWLGGAVARTTHRHGVQLSARLPHPFRFNEIRAIEGEDGSLERREAGRHLQLMYRARIGSRFGVSVFAGPSWIKAEQDVVTALRFDEAYPFDIVTFAGASSTRASKTGATVGFGASLDVAVFGPLALGAQVRRAATTVEFEVADGRRVRATVGGTQVLVDARVTF